MQDVGIPEQPTPSSFSREALQHSLEIEMKDYPSQTKTDVVDLVAQQYEAWSLLKSGKIDPSDHLTKIATQAHLGRGSTYRLATPEIRMPKRTLSTEEATQYDELKTFMEQFTSGQTFDSLVSTHPTFRPDTRFYISLLDGQKTPELVKNLTIALEDSVKKGEIPFWRYKMEGGDEQGNMRFDFGYRDKGASVILYTSDESLGKISELLEAYYSDPAYHSLFLPQQAPFKFAPHNLQYEPWHISMEYGTNNNGNTTPEMAIASAVPKFNLALGFNTGPVPPLELWGSKVKEAWEVAWKSENRDPKRPYITTDRQVPQFLTQPVQ
jgi:hypothetical protein